MKPSLDKPEIILAFKAKIFKNIFVGFLLSSCSQFKPPDAGCGVKCQRI